MPLGPQMKSNKNGTKKICVNGFIFEWKWKKKKKKRHYTTENVFFLISFFVLFCYYFLNKAIKLLKLKKMWNLTWGI